MNNLKSFLLLLYVALLVFSCKTDTTPPHQSAGSIADEKGLPCKVINPAGEMLQGFDKVGLPPFFNVGQITLNEKTTQAILLSPKVKNNQTVPVDVIGMFSFSRNNAAHKYVIVLPRKQNVNNLEREYEEYLSKNSEVKMMIENWFRSQCEVSQCRNFRWDNAYKALLEMEV